LFLGAFPFADVAVVDDQSLHPGLVEAVVAQAAEPAPAAVLVPPPALDRDVAVGVGQPLSATLADEGKVVRVDQFKAAVADQFLAGVTEHVNSRWTDVADSRIRVE